MATVEDELDDLHNGWGALFDDGFDDDAEYNPHDTQYDSDQLSHHSEWDPVDILEDVRAPPIQLHRTRVLRERLGPTSKLDRVLAILKEHHLYAKPEKCTFEAEELEYLGVIVGNGKFRMDPVKVEAVRNWPATTSLCDL